MLQMTLFDPITPSGAQAVMEWVRLHHESVTGRDGYSDFYKKDLTIDVLGPVGDIVSEWVLKGAFIKEANFGDYNWDTADQAVNLTMTLAIDYCCIELLILLIKLKELASFASFFFPYIFIYDIKVITNKSYERKQIKNSNRNC
jgi:hypothetical protein